MEINDWNLFSYCKIGECGAEVIMSLLCRAVHPTTIYKDIMTHTPVNHDYRY
jgi:hypothetical protein